MFGVSCEDGFQHDTRNRVRQPGEDLKRATAAHDGLLHATGLGQEALVADFAAVVVGAHHLGHPEDVHRVSGCSRRKSVAIVTLAQCADSGHWGIFGSVEGFEFDLSAKWNAFRWPDSRGAVLWVRFNSQAGPSADFDVRLTPEILKLT